MLLEQGQLSRGTTWHAAGLVGQLRATESGTRLVQYSAQLYSELEAETGLATGFKRCGGVTVARTRGAHDPAPADGGDRRGLRPRVRAASARPEPGSSIPILETRGPRSARSGSPATARPTRSTSPPRWRAGARERGARIFERTRVHRHRAARTVRSPACSPTGAPSRPSSSSTAPGSGPRRSAQLAGVNVPLHSAEHFYVVTEQIEGVHRDLPILRDPDGYTYFKEEVGGLVVGGFEPEAKPWVAPDAAPLSLRVPAPRRGLGALRRADGLRAAPDPRPPPHGHQEVLQRARELHARQPVHPGRGARAARLLRRRRLQLGGHRLGGGAGRALAEWIVEGEPTSDLVAVDIRRFASFNGNNQWLHDRVGEILGLHYEIPWPNRELRRHGRSADPRPITSWSRPARSSARRWAGSEPTSSHRRASSRCSTTPGTSRSGSTWSGRRAARRRARRSPSTTRPRSASS